MTSLLCLYRISIGKQHKIKSRYYEKSCNINISNLVYLRRILTGTNNRKGNDTSGKKAAQEALDKMLFQEAKEAIDNQTFVLEADRVYFKYGTSAFVSSNTNFVGLDGDKAVVQVAFNVPFSGPNGLGGITVDGNASNYKVKTDKKVIFMSV